MTNPAMPAQPVQPGGMSYQASPEKPDNIIQALLPLLLRAMQPQNPSAAYGGFQTPAVGSGQSQAIPGIPTPIAPTSIPKGTEAPQAYPLANVSGPGPAVPPGPASGPVGLPTPENHEIGPDALQTQYEKLTKQRELLAVPESTEGTYYAPSEDLKDQITGWMGNYVAYATRPQELGGLGMSPFNARIAAQVQARRSFPKINPDDLSAFAQTAGEGSKEVPGRGGVEIGPQRVARELRSPTDLAKVLAKKQTQDYVTAAREYREGAGASASANGFADFMFNRWKSEAVTKQKQKSSTEEQGRNDFAKLRADWDLAVANGEKTKQDREKALAAANVKLQKIISDLDDKAAEDDSVLYQRLRDDAQEMSVAAAVAELY